VKLSPLDIQQQKFSVKFRGYDVDEVETFLEAVAQEAEEYIHKVNELNEELERKNERIWEYQNMEKTLKETLMIAQAASEEVKHNAQKAAEDIREHAQREAESTISDAKHQAGRILEEANAEMARLLAELSNLKGKKIILQQELRSILETHLNLLDEQSQEPEELPDNDYPALNE
jgi:cell division initiation protein